MSIQLSVVVLVASAAVLVTVGVRFTRLVDRLADRTGMGEAIAGAVLLGATTSLPGLVTSTVGAASGEAGFAISNAVGGIAAQTMFLALADLAYRRVNLEHAAASLPNLVQTMTLVGMVGIVLAATGSPEVTLFGVHPASVLLITIYGYGLVLAQRTREEPMWEPEHTGDTIVDEPEPERTTRSTRSMWIEFAVLAAVVGGTGWGVGTAGLSLAEESGLSGSLVGALFTSIITSLPELVTVLVAVRIGAVTLAVADIIGGNMFDVLFVSASDVAYRDGSIYHATDAQAVFMMALTVILTALLGGGLLAREQRHIGFEGVAILGFYGLGVLSLVIAG